MKATLGKVNHGDCIKGMNALEPGSVDFAFADPPFNIGYEYDAYDDRQDHEKYLDWSRQWIQAVYRVLKPTGSFWLAIGDEYAAELKLIAQNAFPGLPICDEEHVEPRIEQRARGRNRQGKNHRQVGFHCRSWVIWYYTFGVHCKLKFTRSHAHLFHFVKNAKDFTFNAETVRVPSARQLVYKDRRANPAGRMPDDTWIVAPPVQDGCLLRPQDLPEGFRADEDMWYFSRVCGTFNERQGWHGCQMPEQLLGRIIRVSSNENDLVLDPFAGSGTTLVVAKKLGRKFVGFELSAEYVKQASERIKAARVRDELTGPAEPLISSPRTGEGHNVVGRRRRAKSRAADTPSLFSPDVGEAVTAG